jgi:uncharacterized protein YndB with AHSA1/START domain
MCEAGSEPTERIAASGSVSEARQCSRQRCLLDFRKADLSVTEDSGGVPGVDDEIRAEAGMLVRRPVAEVFRAVVDPEITTKFWFTRSTGRLEAGKRVTWNWEMYGHSAEIDVEMIDENRRIVMRWPAYEGDARTTVEWTFAARSDNGTCVSVSNTGFTGTPAAIATQAIDATGGFALVLAGMKALLEHDLQLNLVRDRFPERVEQRPSP